MRKDVLNAPKLMVMSVGLALALIGVGACGSDSGTEDDGGAGQIEEDVLRVHADLTPEEEVPGPGARGASGSAALALGGDENQVCYEVDVEGIKATAAHIHYGEKGESGDVVVDFKFTGSEGSGCVPLQPELLNAIESNPNDYYVNVHSDDFPDGAIRGQLELAP